MAIPGGSVTARAQRRRMKPDGAFKPLSGHFKKKKKIRNTKRSHGSASATNPNFVPLGKNDVTEEWKNKDKSDKKKAKKAEKGGGEENRDNSILVSTAPASEQLHFFLDRFQAAHGIKLSSLELEAFKDTCFVELSQDIDQDVENFSKHMKDTFGTSWKEVLYDGRLSEGKIQAGSPALLIVSTSALRSLELLRGLQSLTRDCRPAKLFAKHIKVEDQVSFLNNRVNIATGTPSRIKKLVDIDALGVSRLAVVVIDMQRDAKGYTLFTLPQVSNEFWDLYKTHFQQRLLQGELRICFYGRTSGIKLESKPNYDE